MAKECSIDGSMVGFFSRVKLKDGVICTECAKRVGFDDPLKMTTQKILNSMTVDIVNDILKGDLTLDNYITEYDKLLTQATVQKLKNDSDQRENSERKEQIKEEAKAPHCPKCGSKNLQIVGNHKKGFSVGKALVGGVLTAGTGVGVLAGFAGKKGKKVDMICMNCGKKFKY